LEGGDTRLKVQSTAGNGFSATEYQTNEREWHTGVGGSTVGNGMESKYYIADLTSAAFRLVIDTFGNVLIGSTSPTAARLTVRASGTGAGNAAFRVEDAAGVPAFRVFEDGVAAVGKLHSVSSPSHVCTTLFPDSNASAFAICSSAAEYVPTLDTGDGAPGPGDLVSLLPATTNPTGDAHAPFVAGKSTEACDGNLLGYITDPEKGADGKKVSNSYLPLAIYGYFPSKVTMEGGPIRRGDPITSSSTPGVGMKADGACRTIGYALEDADEDGRIQVFAHLSESSAGEVTALKAEVASLKEQNATLEARLAAIEQLLNGGAASVMAAR
jgi:hypothetical protein